MSVFGSPNIQSVAGLNQAERTKNRDAERKKQAQEPTRTRGTDEVEVQSSQTTDAVRDPDGNERDEASSDRKRQGQSSSPPETDRSRLDVRG